jgi:hypothetical protein
MTSVVGFVPSKLNRGPLADAEFAHPAKVSLH